MKNKKISMRSFVAIPDIISLLNLSFGFLAILLAFNNQIITSATFIVMAIIFDSLDGWIARKLKRNDEMGFGKNIDSLSDAVSFGISPGVLLYVIGSNSFPEYSYIIAIISLLMAITGILRLTRFNIISNMDFKGFIGLPIPTTAIIMSTLVLSGIFNIYLASILMIVSSILMISTVHYPKINNLKVICFTFLLIIMTIIPYPFMIYGINLPAVILFILSLFFTLIYPLTNKIK
jgi:archaetidylserine synthase